MGQYVISNRDNFNFEMQQETGQQKQLNQTDLICFGSKVPLRCEEMAMVQQMFQTQVGGNRRLTLQEIRMLI